MRLPLAALALALTTGLTSGLSVLPTPAGQAATDQAAAASPSRRVEPRQLAFTRWETAAKLRTGAFAGTTLTGGKVVLGPTSLQRTSGGVRYDVGRWTSSWVRPGFNLTELIPSWTARTPGRSRIEVQVRARSTTGVVSSWDLMGTWAATDRQHRRATVTGQKDDLGQVKADTWATNTSTGARSWQVRVVLLRPAGGTAQPHFRSIGAIASRIPVGTVATSKPGVARGITLDVPRYSQMTHSGTYRQWGGGGQAWCSPTSTSMVLGYHKKLPAPATYRSWLPADQVDPQVVNAARQTYDHGYRGTGNWAFNTAYAAGLAGDAFVTRLHSLRQAERFIKAGVPLVVSISFGRGGLSGAPISATNGHLVVIVGFTESGDVIVNDPAASTRNGVRRTYRRAQFENVWLPTSGGLTYVIRPSGRALPTPGPLGSW